MAYECWAWVSKTSDDEQESIVAAMVPGMPDFMGTVPLSSRKREIATGIMETLARAHEQAGGGTVRLVHLVEASDG